MFARLDWPKEIIPASSAFSPRGASGQFSKSILGMEE